MSVLSSLPEGTITIDPRHSRVGFSVRHAMVTKVRGNFDEFSGSGSVENGVASLHIEISATSITTSNPERDTHLRSPDFFDVANFPKLTFASTSIKDAGANKVIVEGNLTLKDVTKPISVEFEFTGTATDPYGNVRFGFEGVSEINRKDFGLTWNAALEAGGLLVSEGVKLEFEISAIATAPVSA